MKLAHEVIEGAGEQVSEGNHPRLNQWLLSLFNGTRFEDLAEHVRNEALEGLDENQHCGRDKPTSSAGRPPNYASASKRSGGRLWLGAR